VNQSDQLDTTLSLDLHYIVYIQNHSEQHPIIFSYPIDAHPQLANQNDEFLIDPAKSTNQVQLFLEYMVLIGPFFFHRYFFSHG
jgi:hypothetical protein